MTIKRAVEEYLKLQCFSYVTLLTRMSQEPENLFYQLISGNKHPYFCLTLIYFILYCPNLFNSLVQCVCVCLCDFSNKTYCGWLPVAHTSNLNYSGGSNQEDQGLNPDWENSS
jgi:hypothetical protein